MKIISSTITLLRFKYWHIIGLVIVRTFITANISNSQIFDFHYFMKDTIHYYKSINYSNDTLMSWNYKFNILDFNDTAKFSNAIFQGRAIFTDAQFKEFANFQLAKFYGDAHFNYSRFSKGANFWGTFHGAANFQGSYFKSYTVFLDFGSAAYFGSSTFLDNSDFSEARFLGKADFEKSHFNSISNFSSAIFFRAVFFKNTQFDSIADFGESHFDDNACFKEAIFNDNTNFQSSIFFSIADFRETHFNSVVDFGRAQFDSTTYFLKAQFPETAIFDNAILPDTLNFSHIKNIGKEIDLTLAKTKSKNDTCNIYLFSSDISKIKIDYNKFKLYFDEQDSLSVDQKASVYNSLLEKFKKDGFNDSYKNLDIEFRNFKAENGNWIEKIFNSINEWWWNYGYDRWWIFPKIIYFVFLFSIPIFVFFNDLRKVYEIEFVENYFKKTNRRLSSQIFASFSYCCILFFGLKINIDKIKKLNGWMIYIFMVYLIGLICLGYLFNFIISK